MKTANRVDGAVKVIAGIGGVCGAVCLMGLGWWVAVPVMCFGGWKLGQGAAQMATGWGDE